MYGVQFGIHQRLVRKFEKAGATSEEKAVTLEEAKLDLQEEYWLDYFAGTFLGKIKKTRGQRYYI
jgi:lysozyme family protein